MEVENNDSSGELIEKEEVRPNAKIKYKKDDFISGPEQKKGGTVPVNFIEFHHSHAYDCRRHFNMCVPDPSTIVFASGSLIHFFNTKNQETTFRRGSTGLGIGHIAKNPMESHIAVGENGLWPPIIIYEWPSMEIVTVLVKGTSKSFSHLAYSPDGKLLASQGGDPDFLITIWDWKLSTIMLRCKSHGQDVYNVMFSPTVSGHLTTSGAGHVKFWKMSKTFTGLKLKGEIGRFGRTEISDVIGFYSMSDEKVLTGCDWGNILVWEEGLIKVEVRRKNKAPCHQKTITQFEYSNGELMSIGMDGWIRVWYYETIDQADPPEDNRFIEVEPIYEFRIGGEIADDEDSNIENSMLMGITKINIGDYEDTLWYAQDGNGGLWVIDLNTVGDPKLQRKLLTCHAGQITDMSVSSWNYFVATCGKDGHLHVYNYLKKQLLVVHIFRDAGSKIIWLPCSLESSGTTIICAFESGVVRVISVDVDKADKIANHENNDFVKLIQVVKPHTAKITAMSINSSGRLLVTGSEDSTIFVFCIETSEAFPTLIPIGFVRTSSEVTCMTWHPKNDSIILVGCQRGECSRIELPEEPQSYTTITYELKCQPKSFRFISVKSGIRREIFRLNIEKQKEEKKEEMRKKMNQYKSLNPGIEIDEETFLMDTDEYPPLPDIHIPEIPNRVLMVNYISDDKIWLWMGGFDAGYIYEYKQPESENLVDLKPNKSIMICDADDTEVHSCLFQNNEYLFLGMGHGEIRVCRIDKEDPTNLSDYLILPMHEYSNGIISKILLSHNEKMLLSCGWDGNLFSYVINEDSFPAKKGEQPSAIRKIIEREVEDIEELNHPSLDEVIKKTEHDRLLTLAKEKKNKTMSILKDLSEEFREILERNKKLPESQRITPEELELDPRITQDLNDHLEAEMDLVYKKLAFKVEKSRIRLEKLMDHFVKPITCLPFAVTRISKPETMVHSFKERILGEDFSATYAEVVRKIEEKQKVSRPANVEQTKKREEDEEEVKIQAMESFLKGLSPETIQYKLGTQINQMLRKYRARKLKIEKRAKEWKEMYASKPDPNAYHPDDISAIELAKKTIGDYKLKVSTNPDMNRENRETTSTKYKELLDCRKKIHYLREDFNDRLRMIRAEKLELQTEVKNSIVKLKAIHSEIPVKYIKPLPEVPEIDFDLEFPERNLEMEKYTSIAEKFKDAKKKKLSIMEEAMNPIDEEYEILLLDESHLRLLEEKSNDSFVTANSSQKIQKTEIAISEDLMRSFSDNDRIETNWEREMKLCRVSRKVYEQDCILRHIKKCIEAIDEKLDKLEKERLKIHADSVYSELFQLTLHQELIVLKNFEERENLLTGKVDDKTIELNFADQRVQTVTAMIEQNSRNVTKMHEKIRELNHQFSNMIIGNKFAEFLKRIFKRKYKPPRANDDVSSDSSTTESSSDDDDDAESLDSREFGLLHMDENICPSGCDQELYEAAFDMRSKRHNLESLIRDDQKTADTLKREVDQESKKMKLIGSSLKQCQQELRDFMLEKQRKLNDIDMTVILKLHQLQHMNDDGFAKIRDCVVFDKKKLSQLYTRVGELQQETLEQKEKHKKNRIHLHRIGIDCKHMRSEIQRLKSEIKQEMIKKFGREVSLSSLYEAVLHRMVYDIKADMSEMTKIYDKEINCVKEKYKRQVQVLENLIQDNTEKLSFLTILEEEQSKLRKILKKKPKSEEEMMKIECEYQDDLARLEEILKNQKHQRDLFRRDIRNLRLKSRPLPPISLKEKSFEILKLEKDDGILEIKLSPDDFETELKDKDNLKIINDRSHEKLRRIDDYDSIIDELATKIKNTSMKIDEIEIIVEEVLGGILASLPINIDKSTFQQNIESSVDLFFENQKESDFPEDIREIIMENFNKLITDMETKSRGVNAGSVQITWDLKPKIDELLHSLGIRRDISTGISLMKYLQMEDGLNQAVDYLLSQLPRQPNEDTLFVLREHATRTLKEIHRQKDEAETATSIDSSISDLIMKEI